LWFAPEADLAVADVGRSALSNLGGIDLVP